MEIFFITGGAGFIGSTICRELVKESHKVIVFDAFIQYHFPMDNDYSWIQFKRFEGIKDKIIFERGDITKPYELRRALKKYTPDRIIHLAALPLADLSNYHSEEALNTCVLGTSNILEAIRDVHPVKRFTYISSSMIYGDFEKEPAFEDDSKTPKDVYGGSKLAGEILVESFGRRFGIEYSIVRPSAVYGPLDINRRVSQIFVENAILGKEVRLHNNGEVKLDFTFVTDTAKGIILSSVHPNAKNRIYNITRGRARFLNEFIEILRKYFPDIKVSKTEEGFPRPKRGTLSIERAKKEIEYCPKIDLEEGIDIYLKFYEEKQKTLGRI